MARIHSLSHAQLGLWFLESLTDSSPVYNVIAAFGISGELDCSRLNEALAVVSDRQEAIRSNFSISNGEPVRVVRDAVSLRAECTDISGLVTTGGYAAALDQANELVRQPFDLSEDVLVRVHVLHTGADRAAVPDLPDHVLVVSAHHLVCDGWSLGILCQEISDTYAAITSGEHPSLPKLSVRYDDYTRWQAEHADSTEFEAQVEHWRSRLAGMPPALDLPTDRVRPPTPRYRGSVVRRRIGPDHRAALETLARSVDTTLFAATLAGWHALLYRYVGVDDVRTGVPVDTRWRWQTARAGSGTDAADYEQLIGHFVNTIVVRSDLSDRPTFTELLARVRDRTLEAFDNQDLPFEQLVEKVTPRRESGRNPLFDVMFSMGEDRARLSLPNAKTSRLPVDTGTAKFDLALELVPTGEGIDLILHYDTDLFTAHTAERILLHYERVLEGMVADPGTRVDQVRILTDDERQNILYDWNDTTVRRSRSSENPLPHERFLTWAAEAPDRVAISYAGESLSYREVDRRSDLLAAELIRLGVRPGTFVPVLLPASSDLPISYLAILKAGGAFVPLDTSWPTARIEMILWDSSASLVVTDRYRSSLTHLGIHQVELTALPKESAEPTEPPADVARAGARDPIYAIYTSGSTGRPKGVVVPCRGLLNRLDWMDETFGAESARAILQTTRHVFDSSVWQLLWPLTHGGTTVIPRRYDALDIPHVLDLIEQQRVTMINFVPTVFGLLNEHLDLHPSKAESLVSLRTLIVGGEAAIADPARRFKRRLPNVRVHNVYGPTEATIGCISHEVEADQQDPIPIGRPIPNTRAVILDQSLELVAPGHPGELCLAGDCLATGYLNNPEATDRAFVRVDLGKGWRNTRVYRTGDVARFRQDGEIEFLGRVDHQVKLHGHRIELGEIEAALRSDGSVDKAVIALNDSPEHGKRLVGYLVPKQLEGFDSGRVRNGLRHRLPDYMVPSVFVVMERFPLTAGGKIDRSALPEPPAPDVNEPGRSYVPPRTETEQLIADVWAELLDLERVGATDNFFDLGGHSLLAVKVVGKLRAALGRQFPLRLLFEHSTVRDLAARLDEHSAPDEETGMDDVASPLDLDDEDGPITPVARPTRSVPDHRPE